MTLISFSRFYYWLITSVFGFQKPDAAAPTLSSKIYGCLALALYQPGSPEQ